MPENPNNAVNTRHLPEEGIFADDAISQLQILSQQATETRQIIPINNITDKHIQEENIPESQKTDRKLEAYKSKSAELLAELKTNALTQTLTAIRNTIQTTLEHTDNYEISTILNHDKQDPFQGIGELVSPLTTTKEIEPVETEKKNKFSHTPNIKYNTPNLSFHVINKKTEQVDCVVMVHSKKLQDALVRVIDNTKPDAKKSNIETTIEGLLSKEGIFTLASKSSGTDQINVSTIKEVLQHLPRSPFIEVQTTLRSIGEGAESLYTYTTNINDNLQRHKELLETAKNKATGGTKKTKRKFLKDKIETIPATKINTIKKNIKEGRESIYRPIKEILDILKIPQNDIQQEFINAFLAMQFHIPTVKEIINQRKSSNLEEDFTSGFEKLKENLSKQEEGIKANTLKTAISSYVSKALEQDTLKNLIPVIQILMDQNILGENEKEQNTISSFIHSIEAIFNNPNFSQQKKKKFINLFATLLPTIKDPIFKPLLREMNIDTIESLPLIDGILLKKIQPFLDRAMVYYTDQAEEEKQIEPEEKSIFQQKEETVAIDKISNQNPELGMIFCKPGTDEYCIKVPGIGYITEFKKDQDGSIYTKGHEEGKNSSRDFSTSLWKIQKTDMEFLELKLGKDTFQNIKKSKLGIKLPKEFYVYFLTQFYLYDRTRAEGPKYPGYDIIPKIAMQAYATKTETE